MYPILIVILGGFCVDIFDATSAFPTCIGCRVAYNDC